MDALITSVVKIKGVRSTIGFGAMSNGVWVGPTAPSNPVTRSTWLITKTGYWAWIDTNLLIET